MILLKNLKPVGHVKVHNGMTVSELVHEMDKSGVMGGGNLAKATNIMEEIIGRALTNSYHKRLAYLEGKTILTLNEYAKQNKLSYSNLLNKASRQTIPAFFEKGVWKIAADLV